jgi:Zn-dependent alcohol dehydrogenase
MQGKIEIDPLADINTAFDLMQAGQAVRSVVVF